MGWPKPFKIGAFRVPLTVTSIFLYTRTMIKILNDHGMFDWDFLSTLIGLGTLVITAQIV